MGKCPNVQYGPRCCKWKDSPHARNRILSLNSPFSITLYSFLKRNCWSNIIYIHAICIGAKQPGSYQIFFVFFVSSVVPTLRTGTLFCGMDSSMPPIPSCRYVASPLDSEPAARAHACCPAESFLQWTDDSSAPALPLAFHRAAHVERLFFFRPDNMSPPVMGLRWEVGGAVMSAVRKLAVSVHHLEHGGV